MEKDKKILYLVHNEGDNKGFKLYNMKEANTVKYENLNLEKYGLSLEKTYGTEEDIVYVLYCDSIFAAVTEEEEENYSGKALILTPSKELLEITWKYNKELNENIVNAYKSKMTLDDITIDTTWEEQEISRLQNTVQFAK